MTGMCDIIKNKKRIENVAAMGRNIIQRIRVAPPVKKAKSRVNILKRAPQASALKTVPITLPPSVKIGRAIRVDIIVSSLPLSNQAASMMVPRTVSVTQTLIMNISHLGLLIVNYSILLSFFFRI